MVSSDSVISGTESSDPDYEIDPISGHYHFALYDRVREIEQSVRDGWYGRREADDCLLAIEDHVSRPWGAYRPMPQQRKMHRSRAQNVILVAGNRAGKTRAMMTEAFWRASQTHPYHPDTEGTAGWICAPTFEKIGDTLWPILAPLLENCGWKTDYEISWHNRGQRIPQTIHLRGARGKWSVISMKAYEQGRETFQSTGLDWIVNDEQCPQDIFIEQRSRIAAGKRLCILSGFTPIIPQPWLEEKMTISKPDSWDIFECPIDDNRISRGGFIADAEIDALIDEWPVEVRPTRRAGKWGSHLGAVFQTFSRSTHVVSETQEKREFFPQNRVPVNEHSIGAIDWGGSNPFVFIWAVKLQRPCECWYIYDEYYWDHRARGQRRLEEHAEEIKSRTKKWQTDLRRVHADWDPTDALELRNHGVISQPAEKDVRAGIEALQTGFRIRSHDRRPGLYIAARCSNLIREVASYHYPEARNNRDPDDKPVKMDDHAVDAARYLIFSERSTSGGKIIKVDGRKRVF